VLVHSTEKTKIIWTQVFNVCACHTEQSHLCSSVSTLPVQKQPHSKQRGLRCEGCADVCVKGILVGVPLRSLELGLTLVS